MMNFKKNKRVEIMMKSGVFVVTLLGLIATASCDNQDDAERNSDKAGEISNIQVTEINEQAVEEETVKLLQETVEASSAADSDKELVTSAADGETVYKKACISCHLTGAAGAPKVGDADAWAPRIARGSEALAQSAISGVPGTAMMAKGACNTCSDDEIKAAVEFMITQSR